MYGINPMRLWLFNLFAAISLLLAVATLVQWCRSLSGTDFARWHHYTAYPDCDVIHQWTLMSADGGLSLTHFVDRYQTGMGATYRGSMRRFIDPNPEYPFFGSGRSVSRQQAGLLHRAGFQVGSEMIWGAGSMTRGMVMPHWFAAILFLFLPAVWLRCHLHYRRRVSQGLCLICGYDLRATPDRCPECGTVIDRAAIG